MILPLTHVPAKTLREPSREIAPHEISGLKKLIADMIETMHAAEGIGLAAPQIGKNIRLAVINKEALSMTEKKRKLPVSPDKDFAIINPKIVFRSRKKIAGEEGCLSVPHTGARVTRSASVEISATLADGRTVRCSADGWLARVFQHEIDHLDGFLILDRANEIWETDRHL